MERAPREQFAAARQELTKMFRVATAELKEAVTRPAGPENVVGFATERKFTKGSWTDQLSIKVYVIEKLPDELIDPAFIVPKEFMGLPTDVEAVGEILALQNVACQDPLVGGISVGHVRVSAGTLGCFVRGPTEADHLFILSNNHVLADSNRAQIGDFVVQPGPSDGGVHVPASHPGGCSAADRCVGRLSDFVPLDMNADNEVDAAIAEVVHRAADPQILGLGRIQGVDRASPELPVQKMGRTTTLTRGTVLADDAEIRVRYKGPGHNFIVWFVDQVAIIGVDGPFSRGGDSGSAILDEKGRIVGLLFAGGTGRTYANHINSVLQGLRIEPV